MVYSTNMPDSSQYTIDIITSALNEEDCLLELFSRIQTVMAQHSKYGWRLIICDNGSTDSTWSIIKELTEKNENVLGIRMSRTFNLDSAFTMGLDYAEADAAVIMASDLQDPPEVISQFIREFELGYEQVVAKVISRKQVPFLRRNLSSLFYIFANKVTNNLIPKGVSDFRLLSRPAYTAARQLRERNRFLRGLLAWTGFKTSVIEIERPDRFAGESEFVKIKLRKVIRWAIDAILAHTTSPLHFVSVIGFLLSGLSISAGGIFMVLWLTRGVPFNGYGTIVGLLILGFSVTLGAIGIMSQYLALIYEEVKQRPLYLIAEKLTESRTNPSRFFLV
jgi:glycosyltransferase involved in cell wall biosynthesis